MLFPFALSEPAKRASRNAGRLLLCTLVLFALPALAQENDDDDDPEPEPTEESAMTATTSGDASLARPSPTPIPEGIGRPILFRGECTPGGGPSACRVIAAAIVGKEGLEPIPCTDEKGTRAKLAARYFAPGAELDLYVRGAPSGTFIVAAEDGPPHGCGVRATGRRLGAPGNTYSFVALLPDDPAQLGAIRFPSGIQPTPGSIAAKALAKHDIGPQQIGVRTVRRMRDAHPTESVMVLDLNAADSRAIVIAEGEGPDVEKWRITFTELGALSLVDAFDLGADGKAEVLIQKINRGEQSEWKLLKRDDQGAWK